MKIAVDHTRCEGHAMCAALVPEQFDVGTDGKVELLSDTVPLGTVSLGQLSDVELAIDSCPTQALRLTE